MAVVYLIDTVVTCRHRDRPAYTSNFGEIEEQVIPSPIRYLRKRIRAIATMRLFD
jgi:hypothetical protein